MTENSHIATDTSTTPVTTPAETTPGHDLTRIRELVLKAHPDVVPDLIRGDSLDDLMSSIEPARTAYQRIADQLRTAAPTATPATTSPETTPATRLPHVPAGGATTVLDPTTLTPTTKIARALEERRKS